VISHNLKKTLINNNNKKTKTDTICNNFYLLLKNVKANLLMTDF
jgi:hypothetical protein